ncbi:heat-labile enterotoxin alpha chain-domain-containing protein [Phaeosphaeriaceae sp. PMI808]|nr:heat-labile enterotoxin alpha chain-domain-containing protein [Phaeosphaeriaceae sp. PMI808]
MLQHVYIASQLSMKKTSLFPQTSIPISLDPFLRNPLLPINTLFQLINMAKINLSSFLFLVFTLWSSLCNAADLYRADSRTPEAIKSAGGFRPKGQSTIGSASPDISLWNHVVGAPSGTSKDNDGYVSTTSNLKVAESWVMDNLGGNGYVYRIHAAPNMIDCKATLGDFNPYKKEEEFAALGGIKYEQIVSWTPIVNKKKGAETKNTAYNSKLFKKQVAGGAQYQLAGFPAGHRAWSETPWINYASCSNPKIRAARGLLQRATCKPKKTNLEFAKAYIATMYA